MTERTSPTDLPASDWTQGPGIEKPSTDWRKVLERELAKLAHVEAEGVEVRF